MTKSRKASNTRKLGRAGWQIGAAIGVLILVVVVLTLKRTTPSETASAVSPDTVAATVDEQMDSETVADPLLPAPDESPQMHLERLLDEGHPVFAFFHSSTCYQCIEMTEIVEQVYPDFSSQVALVDVNVYDDRNQPLLQQAGIRVIPTLIFFDRDGNGQGATGVMPAEELEAALKALRSGEAP